MISLQASTFLEDLNTERKDHAKARSKMAEMETQNTQQFRKMGEKLGAEQQQSAMLHSQLKEAETRFQTEMSQANYQSVERESLLAEMDMQREKLEVRV